MKRLRIVSAATCAMFLASMVPWGVALAKPKKPEPPAPVTSTSVQSFAPWSLVPGYPNVVML